MKNLNDFKLSKTASKNVLGGAPPIPHGTYQKTHSGGAEFRDYVD